MRLGTIAMYAQGARLPARDLGAHSRRALDRPLSCPGELWVAVAADRGALTGAFQRGARDKASPIVRRGSGGPAVLVGPGTVHVALALASPGAIVPCDEKRIVNRAVRPLLKALTKTVSAVGRPGVVAHFFGRDWVSVGHRPAAWVGFGHDAGTRRTLFEAFIAVSTPFAPAPRPSLLDKAPTTLDELAGAPVAPERVAEAILDAYLTSWPVEGQPLPPPAEPPDDSWPGAKAPEDDEPPEPPWAAAVDEAIGPIGAGPDHRGAFRVGGDLLVSRDALARLEEALPVTKDEDVGALVDATLSAPGVALDGVRSLTSVRDAILRARERSSLRT